MISPTREGPISALRNSIEHWPPAGGTAAARGASTCCEHDSHWL